MSFSDLTTKLQAQRVLLPNKREPIKNSPQMIQVKQSLDAFFFFTCLQSSAKKKSPDEEWKDIEEKTVLEKD